MFNNKPYESTNAQRQICEVNWNIPKNDQTRMLTSNAYPAISLRLDDSHIEAECLKNIDNGGNHAAEVSSKSKSPNNNETGYNEDILHSDSTKESESNISPSNMPTQIEIEDSNDIAPQIEEYKAIQKHDAGNSILAVVGDNNVCNQKHNVTCTKDATTENHLEKTDSRTSPIDGSVTTSKILDSVVSLHPDNIIRETRCIRSLKDKPKLKQEARNKQRLSSINKKETINKDKLSPEREFKRKSSDLKDPSKLMKQKSQGDQQTSHSGMLALGNSPKCLQEGKQSRDTQGDQPTFPNRMPTLLNSPRCLQKGKQSQDSQGDLLTSHSGMLASGKSPECLQKGKQSQTASAINVTVQVEGNKSTEKCQKETVCVEDSESPSYDGADSEESDVKSSEESNIKSWMKEVTSSRRHAIAFKGKNYNIHPVSFTKSGTSNTKFVHPKSRNNSRRTLYRQKTTCIREEVNDLFDSPKRGNICSLPLSTANVTSTNKDLVERDTKTRFQHLSACIETEIHKPSPPLLAMWSMVEKNIEGNENLVSDLIINEDGLKVNSMLEEETSDFKNLWEELEQTSHRALLASQSMRDREAPCNSAEEEDDDDIYANFCMNKHEFILDEEIGIICQVCKFVKTEIRNIFSPFQVWSSERSQMYLRSGCYMNKDFGNIMIPPLDKDSVSCQSHDLFEQHDSVWKIIPELEKKMNVHQKRAFEFLWRNIAGSLVPEEMKDVDNDVGGCIIAHAPGTGKTFTIISFLQSYMTLFPRCKPLIIAPKSMLHTWAREFQKWNVNIPVYILNSLRDFRRRENPIRLSAMLKAASIRQIYNINCIATLHEWHKKGSVVILSYPLFFTLTNEEHPFRTEETKQIGTYLTQSPGLLILDEGHIPRSHRSKIWNLLMRAKTKLRILLSGTLFQNNFEEYFNTLCLARPTFVDRVLQLRRHRSRGFEREQKEKIARRYFVEEIAKNITTRSSMERGACRQLLKSLTEDFIDVYNGDVLNSLPGLRIYNVMLRPTPLQEKLLKHIEETIMSKNGSSLEMEVIVSVVSIHPSLFKDIFFVTKYFDSLDLEMFRNDPDQGAKLKFVVRITKLCCAKGEKLLIFCQYIPPLLLLEEMFQALFQWSRGEEMLVLEGRQAVDERQETIDRFSREGGKARVLLASIKACGVGVNLTEASRVILVDPVWNPSCSKQAICRAFRMGQKRLVHVYQLIAVGTLEEEKYEKSVWKERMSNLIYSSDGRHHVQPLRIEDDLLRQLVEEEHASRLFHRIMQPQAMLDLSSYHT